jgi:DNA repair protein RecN (Recombination protein N)
MLLSIDIQDFMLIHRASLHFGGGLTTITGETGAGKSMLLDALGLLFGDRASADVVRAGAREARIHGVLTPRGTARLHVARCLEQVGLEDRDELLIRRVISSQGGSRAWVNDMPVTVQWLAQLAEGLVDRMGQHEQVRLLRPATHRAWVDAWAGHDGLLVQMQSAWETLRTARESVAALEEAGRQRGERSEFLRFQIRELETLRLRAGEYDELDARIERAKHHGRLLNTAQSAALLLHDADGSSLHQLRAARGQLERVQDIDPALGTWLSELVALEERLREVGREVSLWAGRLEEPMDIDGLHARHEQLRRAMRRFGGDEADLMVRLEAFRAELRTLEGIDDALADAQLTLRRAESAASDAADRLETSRREAAATLLGGVRERLESLGMPHTVLETRWEGDRLHALGRGEVELHFSANPGQAPAPLRRAASGGELSRLLLALKVTLQQQQEAALCIFDEVDTGIGGATAAVVGRMLVQLAAHAQVICITHQPQVAAGGHHRLHVHKVVEDGQTRSLLRILEPEERAGELARMLGGLEVADSTLEHARQLEAEAARWRAHGP